jgi:HAD superfamily hydrolase (TIGR01509 family)
MPSPVQSLFSAAIFDMDGLLLDSERMIMGAWLAAAGEEGMRLAASDFLQVVGRDAAESQARLTQLLGGPDTYQRVRQRTRQSLSPQAGVLFPLKPGALALLQQLRQRSIPCAVASSTYLAEVQRRLRAVAVLDYFQALVGGDEVLRSKPDPSIYLLAASRIGMTPERCLAFEDSDHGAQAAHAAGMRVVVVPDLKPHTDGVAYLQLPSLEHALAHLERWFAA